MIAQSLLPEFDNECATTRRVLARVPEDKWDWRPHEKSFTMGQLAGHLANILLWAGPTMTQDVLDIEPDGVAWKLPEAPADVALLLAAFDRNRDEARAALDAGTDQRYMGMWSLAKNGQIMFTMPRIAVVRVFVMNHSVHHRGQLSVYLRLVDAEVPSIYGPSADDPGGL